MTHKERAEVREAMKAYKAEGHTMAEVADKFGYTKGYVQRICKGIAPQQSQPEVYRNQYTNGAFDREANARKYVERIDGYEYAGNFTGVDGYVDIRCKKCGSVQRKSMTTIRHGRKPFCYTCIDNDRAQKKAEKEKAIKTRRARRKYEALLNKNPIQSTFKICPICNSVFTGNSTYCSPKCRENNKWRMKDGYRYLFPLNEVYERDGGVCYLCGKKCDWNDYEEHDGVVIYGNMYPSRDHVVPKSKGGKNTWSNIRLAHRICNSLKSYAPLVEKKA